MDKLNVLWTSDNADTAINMVAMYATNAKIKGFFNDVTVIIWGGANTLIRDNKEVQDAIKDMLKNGVEVKACLACAKNIGTVEILESLGVELDYMGAPLTKIVKDPNQYLLSV